MIKLRQVLKKILIGLMVFVLVFTAFSSSVDTVSAHRRGVTHTRKHKVRHSASGHAKNLIVHIAKLSAESSTVKHRIGGKLR